MNSVAAMVGGSRISGLGARLWPRSKGLDVIREVPTAATCADAGLFFGLALRAEADVGQQQQAALRDRFVAALAETKRFGIVGDPPERPGDPGEQSDTLAVATGRDHLAHLGERGRVVVDLGDRVVAQGLEGQVTGGDQLGAAFEEAGAEGRDLGGSHRIKVSELEVGPTPRRPLAVMAAQAL